MVKYGIIYKITNKINGKIYIGQTTRENPHKRINNHFIKSKDKDLVYKAFLKYGKDSLDIEIICSTNTLENLNILEQFFIQYYGSLIPHGYNIKLGGKQGGKCSKQLKDTISLKVKEYYKTHDGVFKGKKFCKDHLKSLSKVRKGFDSIVRKLARERVYKKTSIPIKAINIETNEEFIFKSLGECAKQLNLQENNISRVLNNKQNRKQHKGYKFEKI